MRAWRAADALPVALWGLGAAYLVWWALLNPCSDGFQNEYLHHGNALDLWGALVDLDQYHLRWYAYTSYWPFGLWVVPWPAMAVLGPTRLALLLGNLVHLAALLWGGWRLGRTLGAPLAPALLLLTPAAFGALVRFEPNLATMGWTAAGLACLVESQGLRSRRWAAGWGLCLGLGLMFDRLTVGFFLVPAAIPLAVEAGRRERGSLALGAGVAALLSVAWYREFLLRHSDELLGQAPVGEIDAAGDVFAPTGPLRHAYYLLSLVDGQAGPLIGALALIGVVDTLRRGRRDGLPRAEAALLWAAVPGLLFFSLVAKKQPWYTLPALVPLIVLGARRPRLAAVAAGGGLWAFGAQGLGLLPAGFPAGDWMPAAWVAPRYTLARPPSRERWPVDAALAELPAGGVDHLLVLSEDERLFEGFLALMAREALPAAKVDSVVGNPQGVYELLDEQDAVLLAAAPGQGWPDAARVEAQLAADHYRLADLPPVADALAAEGAELTLVGRWPAGGRAAEDIELSLWVRRAPAAE